MSLMKAKAEEDAFIAVVANSDSKAQISKVKSCKKVYLKRIIFYFLRDVEANEHKLPNTGARSTLGISPFNLQCLPLD